jgi:hypothetical protein
MTTTLLRLFGVLALLPIVHGCNHANHSAHDAERTHTPRPTTAPAAHGGHGSKKTDPGVASLDVYASGPRLHLLTAHRDPGQPAQLRFQRSDDAGQTWSSAVLVAPAQPPPSPVTRGQDAQIAAAGDIVVAAWTTAGTEDRFGRGPIATALSSDGGRTWTPGPNPADDNSAAGHAFIDLAATDDGAFHIVWLDGRPTPSESGQSGKPGKGLRYARSTDGGRTWSANLTLDPATCECCWNTIATAPGGRISVLYRDKTPRDMAVVHSEDAGRTWGAPVRVGRFEWATDTCPHVGGALAFDRSTGELTAWAIAWTARGPGNAAGGAPTNATGAYLLASPDAGRTWSAPQQLARDPRSWHADLAIHNGTLAATWDAYTDDGPCAFYTVSRDGGVTWSKAVQLNPLDTSATHPRLIATPSGFRAFWSQIPAEGNVATWQSRALQ